MRSYGSLGPSRMLKKAASFVLASLQASTYRQKVRLGFSLAAAALDDLFEHPARSSVVVLELSQP